MEKESKLAKGFFFKKAHEKAPEFVKGNLSIKVDEAIAFLKENEKNGWVNIDLLKSLKGTLYLKLNEWEKPKDESKEINDDEIPF